MKYLATVVLATIFTLNASGQKVASVELTTTAPQATVLDQVKTAGKSMKYGTKDMDSIAGTFTLWKYFVNANVLAIHVSTETKDTKTILRLKIPHVRQLKGSYTKELRKLVDKLELPDMVVGEYFDEIE